MNELYRAVLIVGPTGCGKTPLGEYWVKSGFMNHSCIHFDFGERLRAALNTPPPTLSRAEQQTVASVLNDGALLEDHQFGIARKLLHANIAAHAAAECSLVVLNGLPRHVGQAEAVDRFLKVIRVVALDCPAEVVKARIVSNAGGDRTNRVDDTLELITAKLSTFNKRTVPLIDYYRERGVPVDRVPVSRDTTPEKITAQLSVSLSVSSAQ